MEVRQEGFDQLSEDISTLFSDTIKQLDADQEKRNEIIRYQLELLDGHEQEASAAISGILTETGAVLNTGTQAVLNKFDTLMNDALDKTWEQGISDAIWKLNTETIQTFTESTRNIEESISRDLNSVFGPLVKDGGSLSDVTGNLKSINDALVELRNAYTKN